MTKELLVSSSPHETKVAVLEDDELVEVYFQRDTDVGLVGGIYKGRVNRVLPGMQSAFVDIGLERDAFLYVSDFFEDSEEYERVFTEAENRVSRLDDTAHAAPAVSSSDSVQAEVRRDESSAVVAPVTVHDQSPSSAPAETVSQRAGQPAVSASPTEPSPSAREYKPHDFAQRRQRRGRRFREIRHGPPREPGERTHEEVGSASSHGIELLPGESLARYGHGAAPASEPLAPEPTPQLPPAEPVSAGSDISSSPEETSSATPLSPFAASPEVIPDQVVPASDEEGLRSSQPVSDHSVEVDQANSILGPEPQPASAATETEHRSVFEFSNEFETHEATNPVAPEEAAVVPRDVIERSTAGEETQPDINPPAEADEAAGHSYTLRDSQRRSRLAPRRGHRGRGRFRGHLPHRHEGGAGRGPETQRAGNDQPVRISELLKEGQEILVQIAKEPLGTKGARITSHIALPGRYLVYMPTISHIGVSRKIGSEDERLRLRNIILDHRGSLTGGFIVRTAAAGRSEEELKVDLSFLANLWNGVRAKAERSKAPALLHRDLTLVERILRDLLSPEFKTIRVDNEIEYEHVLEFISRFQPSLIGHARLYTRDAPVFEEFGVQGEIDRALKPKVWLKSGGYIVINQTEALVAIDVNTGKYVGRTNRLEDTIVKINMDAVKEIVRQIRLRDLGGIIVIDFIDMDERRNRAKVVQALEDSLRRDRAPTKILAFNEFGLVALTRKRVKHSLERALCEPCPYCTGAGWIKSVSTITYDILSEARKMASQVEGDVLHLRVNPQVAATLKAKDGVLLSEIESTTRKEVVIQADPSVHQEQFEIY